MRLSRATLLASLLCAAGAQAATFSVTVSPELAREPLDGRLLLLLSVDDKDEPRFQIEEGQRSQQVFGIDVSGWTAGKAQTFDSAVLGYPRLSLADVPRGSYRVQVLLHKYETFKRKDGHTVRLPMDRGEGQVWSRAPGNLYSAPRSIAFDPATQQPIPLVLDQAIEPIKPPADTQYVKHERIQSKLLTEFWGRPMHLGAHVLLPQGFDQHPKARYPLMIFHGHFAADLNGFRPEPPDPNLKPEYSERFRLPGYNRIQQELAHQFYKDWTGPDFPRAIVIEIQHANPYYDDSYAVNSANLGPYADAIQQELIPYLEKKYRAIGAGWARFVYGGSTGGWEALAVQVLYPDFYNGAFAACPDPIDFRAYGDRERLRGSQRVLGRQRLEDARHASRYATTSGGPPRRSKKRTAWSWCSPRTAARPDSGISGRPCSHPWAPTVTPNRSGTSAPARSIAASPRTGARTSTSCTS